MPSVKTAVTIIIGTAIGVALAVGAAAIAGVTFSIQRLR